MTFIAFMHRSQTNPRRSEIEVVAVCLEVLQEELAAVVVWERQTEE